MTPGGQLVPYTILNIALHTQNPGFPLVSLLHTNSVAILKQIQSLYSPAEYFFIETNATKCNLLYLNSLAALKERLIPSRKEEC